MAWGLQRSGGREPPWPSVPRRNSYEALFRLNLPRIMHPHAPADFLGLSDEPVFEDEAPQEKKGWWQKFWDE